MDDNCEPYELMTDDDKIRVSEIMNDEKNLDENISALSFVPNPETQVLIDEIDIKLKVFQAEKQVGITEVIIPNQYTDEYLDTRIKEIDDKLSKIKNISELCKKEKKLEGQNETTEDLKQEDCEPDENEVNEKNYDIEINNEKDSETDINSESGTI